MPKLTFKGLWDLWEPWERKMLIGVMVILIFFAIGAIVDASISGDHMFWITVSNILGMFMFVALLAGIFFYSRYKKMGIVPTKRIWSLVWKVALIIGLVITTPFYLDLTDTYETGFAPENEDEEVTELPLWANIILFGVLFLGFSLAGLLIPIFTIVAGMGLVGVICLLEAGYVPVILRWVKRLTSRDHMGAKALGWLLLIPDTLDTGTLKVDMPKEETTFPWDRYKQVVMWQLIIGFIIASYLSFNPFLLKSLGPQDLFNLLSNSLVIIPILVIPWFIILRLNARIDGPVKEFTLFGGIRSRMLRTFLVIGSLLIFIRITIEEFGMREVLLNFIFYIIMLVFFSLLFSFLYLNFFEYELAKRVVSRLPWMDPVDNRVSSPSVDEADGEVPESVG